MSTQEPVQESGFSIDYLRLYLARVAEKNGKAITVALIALILAIAVYLTVRFVSGNALEDDSARWAILGATQNLSGLQEFAKNHPNTIQAAVAKMEAARQLFAQGMTLYAATTEDGKKEAINSLDKSIELFESVINDPKLLPEQKAQALLNIGSSHEALRRFEKAREYYALAASMSEKTASGALASRKLDALKSNQQGLTDLYKNFE